MPRWAIKQSGTNKKIHVVSLFWELYHVSQWVWYLEHNESESESHSVVSNSLQPRGLYSPWHSPGQNTGVSSHSLLQEIFPTQESNPGLLHCGQILYQLSHQGSQLLFNLSVLSDSFVTPWTVAHEVPLSTGFLGKNTGVGWHFLLQKELLLMLLDQANKLSQIH